MMLLARLRRAAPLAALLVATAAMSSLAAKGARIVDQVWTNPTIAASRLGYIAMLPVSTFDNNLPAATMVAGAWGQKFAGSGYRWISGTTSRDLIRAAGGDSLLKAVRDAVLKSGRPDSLTTPALCKSLHVNGLLAVRIDLWSQVTIQPDQAGKPSTTVQLRAALVDSTGRLVWTISGSETAEGQYVEPAAGDENRSGTAATRSSGLGATAAPPPSYLEVLDRLLARWAPLFPARATASGVAAPAPAAAADSLKPAPNK